jgi:hypothetical protein
MTKHHHPQHDILTLANIELDCGKYYLSQPDVPDLLKKNAQLYITSLETEIDYLSLTKHPLIFIGDIGVGKTTGISQLFNLIIGKQKPLQERIILTTGAGGTTICEVSIISEVNYSLKTEPLSIDKVQSLVQDWTLKFFSDNNNNIGVSKEVDRAIRNMADLALLKPKKIDGKLIKSQDPAEILAQECDNSEDMTEKIWQRMNYQKRVQTEMIYCQNEVTGEQWLKTHFTEINNGKNLNFPLPQKIEITIPKPILPLSPYNIEIVDTKGVDGTAIREDLQAWVKNPYSVIILCTRFNSAPDISIQQFFEYLNEIGLQKVIQERISLLVLPRPDEARAGDAGEIPDGDEEGYLLKETQIRDRLQQFGASNIPIHFFNAQTDDSQNILSDLSNQIEELRDNHIQRLNKVITGMKELINNPDAQLALASQHFVNNSLQSCLNRYHNLSSAHNSLQFYITKVIKDTHQRTVWAMVKRCGDWDNLSISFLIGYGARAIAQQQSEKALGGLQELLETLCDNDELSSTHNFLEELLETLEYWHDDFLNEVESIGKIIFTNQIESANFWDECLEIYGSGQPFRQVVIEQIETWFQEQETLQDAFKKVIQSLWEEKFLAPIKELCQEEDND